MKDLLVAYLDDPTPARFRELRDALEDEIAGLASFIAGDEELAEKIAAAVFTTVRERATGRTPPSPAGGVTFEDLVRAVPSGEEVVRGLGVQYLKAAALIVAVTLGRRSVPARGFRGREAAALAEKEPLATRLEDVRRAILSLPVGQGECAALVYLGQLEPAEIALLFGLSRPQARRVLDRCHSALLERLRLPTLLWLAAAVEELDAGDRSDGATRVSPALLEYTRRLAQRSTQ
jgi:hypothetical protein